MRVTWSPRSRQELAEILDYLFNKWGVRSSLKFLDQLDTTIFSIQEAINASRLFEKERNIRKILVRKQVSLYYRVRPRELEILSVFVNSRNPKNLDF